MVLVLLEATGSVVEVAAVVVMLSTPLAGAVKVLVHTMLAPDTRLVTGGVGVHDCVAPNGRPDSEQVAAAALLGPAFVQVPLTVTL